MKNGRGAVEQGDIWGELAVLQIGNVAVRKDVLERLLEEGWGISNALRTELGNELAGILGRWGATRDEEADQKKRPLLNSYDRGGVEKGIGGGGVVYEWPQNGNGYGCEV